MPDLLNRDDKKMPIDITEKLTHAALKLLEDAKAENILALDVRKMTSIADTMIICSARSSRHLNAIAEQLAAEIKAVHRGLLPKVSGHDQSGWILVDLGDVIVHVMTDEMREFYALEKLWQPQ